MELNEAVCQINQTYSFDEKMKLVRDFAKTKGRPGVIKLAPLVGYAPNKLLQYADIDNFLNDRKRGRHNRKPRPRLPFVIEDRELPQNIAHKLNAKTVHWPDIDQANDDYCDNPCENKRPC